MGMLLPFQDGNAMPFQPIEPNKHAVSIQQFKNRANKSISQVLIIQNKTRTYDETHSMSFHSSAT